ncbi:hypothetical protein Q8A73_012824 [Channa argus]|nr:hypothetical protein Q8A73_012824 [Channa argus]
MSANGSCSSSSNSSCSLPPPSSKNFSSLACFELTVSSYIFTALSASYIFFLPLSILIFHLGVQRWRKQRSNSAVTTSNSDVFTYNIVAMELIGMLGSCFYFAGIYTNKPLMKLLGVFVFSSITPGQALFHSLTSLDRYLAVMHPILYLGLKKSSRIRNVSIFCVWVASFGWVGITALFSLNVLSLTITVLLIVSVIFTSFCSVSILRVLVRPGPGERGGNKQRVDRLKKRAFITITIITGALLLKLGGELLCFLVDVAGTLSHSARCVALMSGYSSTVPSSYVLPLLFLHRAGKLPCCKYKH